MVCRPLQLALHINHDFDRAFVLDAVQLVGLHDIVELEGMRDHGRDIDRPIADPLQGLARAGVVRFLDGADIGAGGERFPEEIEDGEVHRLETGHAEVEDEAVFARDLDGEADRFFFAGRFDDDIGQLAAVDCAQGVGGWDVGVVQGVGGAVSFAVGEAVGFEIEGDDFGGVAALQGDIEPEAGGALADDGDGLAAQVGRNLAAKSTVPNCWAWTACSSGVPGAMGSRRSMGAR